MSLLTVLFAFAANARRAARTHGCLLAICCLCIGSRFALVAQAPTVPVLPAGMVYDATGNLFVADARQHQVIEVSVGGELSVVAGTGEQGFAGDGGSAKSAMLNAPQGLTIGPDGTLYIADTGNRRIRAVSQGRITTIAGTEIRGDSGDGGSATAASFDQPTAIAATASGALLICDTGNHRVRQIANGKITAFAGSGVQGFAGDGGAATGAQLDSPHGVAVTLDGRVIIADSHNHRLRMVGADGTMQTIAGTGARGFSGDNGPATTARLFLPQGVTVSANGAIIFADSDNQRIRMVDSSGAITTLAGSGVQGAAQDAEASGTGSLNVPKSIALSPYSTSALGDASAQSLKAVALDNRLYLVPAPASRTSTVILMPGPSLIYGQMAGNVTVNAAAHPQGKVDLYEAGVPLASAKLSGKALVFTLPTMPVGNHTLTARYAGDGINPEAVSTALPVTVQPANASAIANLITVAYGAPVPALTGTLTGILPQDASSVAVSFSTSAGPFATVGSYPITAMLTGPSSGNYALSNNGSAGTLTVRQASSTTTMQAASQSTYAGLPLTMAANVLPEVGGSPTGEVDFIDNGAVVAKANLVNGSAAAIYLNPPAGSRSITASYLGSTNFAGSNSVPQSISVNPVPDFALSSNGADQSVQAGLTASFPVSVASKDGAFSGSVTFSVTGLPSGATASFAPTSVVPGSSGANTVLNIQTPALHAQVAVRISLGWCSAIACLLLVSLKRRRSRVIVVSCCLPLLLFVTGCGARLAGTAAAATPHTYPLVITGTSTNLAGNIVTHTLAVTLTTR